MEVLFDVDGVLVFPWRFREYLINELGLLPEMTRSFFEGPFVKCTCGERDLFTELEPYLKTWGWSGTVESFVEIWFAVENAPDSRVLHYVDELRRQGIPCHVASTQERHRAAFLSGQMGFAGRFDSLQFSCDLGAAKPDPEYFRRVQERLRRPAHRLLFVDDSMESIEGALEQGWGAVHYSGGGSLEEVSRRLRRVV